MTEDKHIPVMAIIMSCKFILVDFQLDAFPGVADGWRKKRCEVSEKC